MKKIFIHVVNGEHYRTDPETGRSTLYKAGDVFAGTEAELTALKASGHAQFEETQDVTFKRED